MRILFVSSMALFRETRFGGAKRLYYFARELEARAEMDLLCVDGCREWTGGPAPAEFRRALFLGLGGRKPLLRRATSLPVDIDEEVERHRGAVEAFMDGRGYDATLLAFPLSLSFLGKGWEERMGRRVYLEDDLLVETYRREAAGPGGPLLRAKSAWRRRQAMGYFRRKLDGAAGWICISGEEREVVRTLFPRLRVEVIKYGLPLEEYPLLPPGPPEVLGFIGNYQHAPNLDAALWMAGELMPALAGAMPGLRLVLAGRSMPPILKAAVAGSPAVRLMEDVEDLASFYGAIGIFVNPIRQGRGLRTKAVEAAAFGRPVLSTPLGAEGLEEMRIPTWTTASELSAGLETLREAARYRGAAEAIRRVVEERFSTAALGRSLLEVLSR